MIVLLVRHQVFYLTVRKRDSDEHEVSKGRKTSFVTHYQIPDLCREPATSLRLLRLKRPLDQFDHSMKKVVVSGSKSFVLLLVHRQMLKQVALSPYLTHLRSLASQCFSSFHVNITFKLYHLAILRCRKVRSRDSSNLQSLEDASRRVPRQITV